MSLDIDPKYLQVETKEDSPSKLAAIAGKLTKFFLFATEFETLRNYINALRDLIDSKDRPYKVYEALLSQMGIDNPTAVVLDNTLSDNVLQYNNFGHYSIVFDQEITGAICLQDGLVYSDANGVIFYLQGIQSGTNTFDLYTRDAITNAALDQKLLNTYIQIRVYE